MKKIIAVLISLIMVFSIASISFADEEPMLISTLDGEEDVSIISYVPNRIMVQNNGEYIDFTDSEGNVVEPQIINDRTMVPFRKIFNALGVKDEDILWNGETRTVEAKKDNLTIELQIDNPVAKKTVSGDVSEIKLDSAPVIVEGRTLVPVRFIAESMSKKVGWDNENRTVIIIDTQELKEDLEKSAPKFVEMTKADVVVPETYDMLTKITGTLEYKDKSNKENNSTINLNGTLDMKKGTAVIEISADAELTGKGQMYNLLKEINFTKFDFDIIANESKIYVNSSLLKDQTDGKWVVIEDDSMKEAFTILNDSKATIDTLFDVKEESMNIYTYESLKLTTTLLKAMCKDENIKITEKGSTRTYSLNMDIKSLLDVYKDLGLEIPSDTLSGSIKSTATYKNNIAQTNEGELKMEYKDGNESLSLNLKIDGKISDKNVTINIPSDSQVVSSDSLS